MRVTMRRSLSLAVIAVLMAGCSGGDKGMPEVTDTITVGKGPGDVAYGDNAIWVTNSGDGTVSRIDPATVTITDTITLGGGEGIAYGDNAIWVANFGDGTVTRIAL